MRKRRVKLLLQLEHHPGSSSPSGEGDVQGSISAGLMAFARLVMPEENFNSIEIKINLYPAALCRTFDNLQAAQVCSHNSVYPLVLKGRHTPRRQSASPRGLSLGYRSSRYRWLIVTRRLRRPLKSHSQLWQAPLFVEGNRDLLLRIHLFQFVHRRKLSDLLIRTMKDRNNRSRTSSRRSCMPC
jgi:hypothetical protein